MNLETLIKSMVRAFFIIATGIVAGNYVICLIFAPDAVFPAGHLGKILLCALVSDLPFVIFYSPRELSKREMLVRQILHGTALLAVLLAVARLWNWLDFSAPLQIIIYLAQVASIYIVVYASSYIADKKTADKLNKGLKKRYQR